MAFRALQLSRSLAVQGRWAAVRGCSSQAAATSADAPSASSPAGRYRRKVERRDFRFIFPEFLPDPDPRFRQPLTERLVRQDQLARREQVELPEFYVGSSLAVQFADPNSPAPNKMSRFVGLCIARGGTGLRAWTIVRNVVDGQGVEFLFDLYSPAVHKIEVLKLERRLDDELLYLRDAPQEYSTVPLDLEPEILPDDAPVPMNDLIVPLNPAPWHRHWQRYADRFQGYSLDKDTLTEKAAKRLERYNAHLMYGWARQVEKYDLLLNYRETIPMEEQDAIWEEVGDALERRDRAMRKVASKRAFSKPVKGS